jgi:hypothetical protein
MLLKSKDAFKIQHNEATPIAVLLLLDISYVLTELINFLKRITQYNYLRKVN